MPPKLVIFGTGMIGQVAHHYFVHDSDYDVVAFTVDDDFVPSGKSCLGLEVVPFSKVTERFSPEDHHLFVAIGYHDLNRLRARRCQDAKDKGYRLASYLSSANRLIQPEQYGENCFIMGGEPIQPHARVGHNCFIWSNAVIGHHSSVGDHAWVTSHATIGGKTEIGKNCFIGLSATIGHQLHLGDDCFIGAGALVTKSAEAKSVWVAEPTALLRLNSDQFLRMTKLN